MAAQRKKLIEVALPLETINAQSAREKSIRHGHPSTLHLWWARRPLAACRAVLFASIVDDPSSRPEEFPTEAEQQAERKRLFDIMEGMVHWEAVSGKKKEHVRALEDAREEIQKATGGNPPPVLDPFCGGGSIPLEAQRLGLEAHASDLNPVAVLITKALIEIPPKFSNQPPVNPDARQGQLKDATWKGAQGLADDVRHYGQWMRDEAAKRIGHLYPNVEITEDLLDDRPDLRDQGFKPGDELTVIAWLWARTVQCPNPACGAEMPLVRSFQLSKKKNKRAWMEPIVDETNKTVEFKVKTGSGEPPEGTVKRSGARCIICGTSVPFAHVRSEGKDDRMHEQMMAIVAEGNRGRVYLAPNALHEQSAASAEPHDVPDTDLPEQALGFRVQLYGMTKHRDLFTPRQLVALTTFSDLVQEARDKVLQDGQEVRLRDAGISLNEGGNGATAYADAVATYLGLALDRHVDRNSTICTWDSSPKMEALRNTFSRQAIPMTWDFAEGNVFSASSGNWSNNTDWVAKAIEKSSYKAGGHAKQLDATATIDGIAKPLICTDPPYYDNIGYADLSDFFYVWLRRSLGNVYPDIFNTLLVPKDRELVATRYRFEGSKERAREFFEKGLGEAFSRIHDVQHRDYPLTLFYAFKQAESIQAEDSGQAVAASTGWETMLEGMIQAGFQVNGTWPMRTELSNRNVGIGTNALASSILLVCRPRPEDASLATRREFISALKGELPEAVRNLQKGNIAPVDLAQAAIGPGMAVFSRYAKVLEADGTRMGVRDALVLINQTLDEVLSEQESEFDPDTRWALAWFEQFAMNEGPYGTAETLSTAKNTSVQGMIDAGILFAKGGKVRLLRREEYSDDWDPSEDDRVTIWEVTQYLIRTLNADGEEAAARLLRRVGAVGEWARELAYRLFNVCERKGWAKEATAYNALVVAWPELKELAARQQGEQGSLEL